MARTVASLPAGSRITDYISLGVVTRFFPREKVDAVLVLQMRFPFKLSCGLPVRQQPHARFRRV